jgi:hypothetical protein
MEANNKDTTTGSKEEDFIGLPVVRHPNMENQCKLVFRSGIGQFKMRLTTSYHLFIYYNTWLAFLNRKIDLHDRLFNTDFSCLERKMGSFSTSDSNLVHNNLIGAKAIVGKEEKTYITGLINQIEVEKNSIGIMETIELDPSNNNEFDSFLQDINDALGPLPPKEIYLCGDVSNIDMFGIWVLMPIEYKLSNYNTENIVQVLACGCLKDIVLSCFPISMYNFVEKQILWRKGGNVSLQVY